MSSDNANFTTYTPVPYSPADLQVATTEVYVPTPVPSSLPPATAATHQLPVQSLQISPSLLPVDFEKFLPSSAKLHLSFS